MEEEEIWWNLLNMLENDEPDEALLFLKQYRDTISNSHYQYMLLFIQAQKGHFEETGEAIEELEKRGDRMLWEARAFLALKKTNFEDVVDFLNRPDEITLPATYMLHKACYMLERYDESYEYLMILKDHINSFIFDMHSAKCMESMQQYDKAAEIYKKHKDKIQYARVCALAGLPDIAKKTMRRYLKNRGKDFIRHGDVASVFAALGEYKKAIEHMQVEIKNTRRHNRNVLYFRLATYCNGAGNPKKCIRILKKSGLDTPAAYRLAGEAYLRAGRYEKAASCLELAELKLDAALALYHAGKTELSKKMLLELENDGEDSSALFQILAEIYRDDTKKSKKYLASYENALNEEKRDEAEAQVMLEKMRDVIISNH